MGVREPSGHVESELVCIVDGVVTKLNLLRPSSLEDLLGQDRV